jgi:hypothetical protein
MKISAAMTEIRNIRDANSKRHLKMTADERGLILQKNNMILSGNNTVYQHIKKGGIQHAASTNQLQR